MQISLNFHNWKKRCDIEYSALQSPQSTASLALNNSDNQNLDSTFIKELEVLRKTISWLKAGLLTTSVALLLALSYATLNRMHYFHEELRLGSDPNGIVPPGIGEPPRWTYFSPDSPYYIPEDTFLSLEKTIDVVRRIQAAHNSSNILVNGHYAKWKHPDGTTSNLPPYYSTVSVRQTYIIRSFHQIHCLASIAEEYGYRVNNRTSQWTPGHIAHCLNAIREAIMCLADATPMSYVNGFANGHVTDDQQFMCRDWAALKRWANEPERGIRYRDTGEGGSKVQKMTEILPFPELSEAEKEGGIDGVGWNGRVIDEVL